MLNPRGYVTPGMSAPTPGRRMAEELQHYLVKTYALDPAKMKPPFHSPRQTGPFSHNLTDRWAFNARIPAGGIKYTFTVEKDINS